MKLENPLFIIMPKDNICPTGQPLFWIRVYYYGESRKMAANAGARNYSPNF